jgi:hypothetical protein
VKQGSEVLAAERIRVPVQVSQDAVFVEVVEPVGRVACPACTWAAGTGERSRRVGIGDDGGGRQGAGVDDATACPTKRSGGGVRPAKRSETGLPTAS